MPIAKAHEAGAAPNEICHNISTCLTVSHGFCSHQIRKRIQLCTHLAAFLPPPGHHAVEEVKEQAERHETERHPDVCHVAGVDAVAHGGSDGHEAAEAVHERDQVGEVVGADEGEVARVGRAEETDLLVLGCSWS